MTTAEIPSQEQLWIEIATLQEQLIKRDEQIKELNQTNSELQEQLTWLKRQIFGKRSERIVSDISQSQLLLPGFENFQTQEEEQKTIPAHTRRKPKGQDKITLPPDLPVKTTILDIPEDQKIYQGKPLTQIGIETSYKLAHQPGSYYLKEIIRPKYAHPQAGILTAELPDTLLPRCRADESLLAEIITKKFADHLPLYRIAEMLESEKIHISRKLLSQWVIRTAMAIEAPIQRDAGQSPKLTPNLHRRKPRQIMGKSPVRDRLYVGHCRRRRSQSL